MRWKGQITIFATLLLLVLLPFFVLLWQLAQKSAAETYFTYAARSARENLKASYCKEFFDRYDLYVMWENQMGAEEELLGVLKKYEDPAKGQGDYYWALPISFQNSAVDIYDYKMATDERGKYLREQIVEAEKEDILLESLLDTFNQFRDYQEGEALFRNIPEWIEKVENVPKSGEKVEELEREENDAEDVSIRESLQSLSFLEFIQSMKEKPIITLLMGTDKISERVIPFPYGVMEEAVREQEYEHFPVELYEKYLIAGYMEKHFEHYKNTTETSYFFELEYILSGAGSDQENMEKAMEKFIWWKGAMNLASALNNRELIHEAETLAATALSWLGNPALIEGGKLVLLAAISYGEAVIDGRRILGGKDVALIKEEEDWMLNFKNAVDVLSNPEFYMESDKNGKSYSQYLTYLLLLEDIETVCTRMMEVMQWNMQQENPLFLMEHCVCGVSYEMRAEAGKSWFNNLDEWRKIQLQDSLQFGF